MKLLREIRSKKGVLHFRRWELFKTPHFDVWLHHILESDKDLHPHNHPWNFAVLILWGSYEDGLRSAGPLSFYRMHRDQFHKVKLHSKRVWSLAFVGKERFPWGYWTENGFVGQRKYRHMKHRIPRTPV